MDAVDQHEFIQDLKAGREGSFVLLYELYGRKIYHLAYRMVGTKEDAEDITQETFVQVHRNIEHFRGDSQLYTWIYAIAKNLCFRWFQRQKRVSLASLEALIYTAQAQELPEEITEWEKQHLINQVKEGCLTGLLRSLSFYQRIAFILHVLLHLPIRDVAQVLEKSEGATKVLIHRARQNLKAFLCAHCSLVDQHNPCRCENLLGFSLKQGWIVQPSEEESAQVIEAQIKGIKTMVELYTSLVDPIPPEEMVDRIQQLIKQQDWVIFSR